MEIRFRPYVEQASYYQFLKGQLKLLSLSAEMFACGSPRLMPAGSYFDTAIETLTHRWPETPSFTHLSIVQDPPPRLSAPPTALTTAANSVVPSAVQSVVNSALTTRVNSISSNLADLTLDSPSTSDTEMSGRSTPPTSVSESPVEPKGYTGHGPFPYLSDRMGISRPKIFAQPIVFFDIKCISTFGASPVAAHLTHLRLRVPSRDLALVLVSTPGGRSLFPSLRYLDISTTNVRIDGVFSALLRSYARLEHLVLDRVNLFGFMARDRGPELCKELGDKVVSAGLVRGKERERQIAAWELRERVRLAESAGARRSSRARDTDEVERNEEGDSSDGYSESPERNAALQVESEEEERQRRLAFARSRRGHRSAGHSTFSLRTRAPRTVIAPSVISTHVPVPPPDTLYLVLPPLLTLKTLSIGGEAHSLSASKVREWEEEFHRGWRDGLGKIMGWANHVSEKYERAIRKSAEWRYQEIKASLASAKSASSGKGKTKVTPKPAGTKPPTDIRLFRFPFPDEYVPNCDPSDPLTGLIEVFPEGKDYLEPYKVVLADAELHANGQGPSQCVLCTVPDCEGPARRGDEGAKLDGRGGMGGKHRSGCGHLYGRSIWGWEGCK